MINPLHTAGISIPLPFTLPAPPPPQTPATAPSRSNPHKLISITLILLPDNGKPAVDFRHSLIHHGRNSAQIYGRTPSAGQDMQMLPQQRFNQLSLLVAWVTLVCVAIAWSRKS